MRRRKREIERIGDETDRQKEWKKKNEREWVSQRKNSRWGNIEKDRKKNEREIEEKWG